MKTVWVMGDQLNRHLGALGDATPDTARVLLVESESMISGRRSLRLPTVPRDDGSAAIGSWMNWPASAVDS